MIPRRQPTFAGAILRLLFGAFLIGLLGRGLYEFLIFGWRFLELVLR